MKPKKQLLTLFFCIVLTASVISYTLEYYFYTMNSKSPSEVLTENTLEAISLMDISGQDMIRVYEYCQSKKRDFSDFLSSIMTVHDFSIESIGHDLDAPYYKKTARDIRKVYEAILDDIVCFPINAGPTEYYYMNSFLAPRSYGGDRLHYGTDIMDYKNQKGGLPIISMTSGRVENIGWNELGGYRIGIRSQHGSYFYYAHLNSYAKGLKEGKKVESGDLLGYMGNTGYGPEGTMDQFPVHLHLGIAYDFNGKEIWINPYPILSLYEMVKLEKVDW